MTVFGASQQALYSDDRLSRFAVVAVPASDEAERIAACLAALAVQRDQCGAPLAAGSFEVLVFSNNCSDATADIARAMAPSLPHPVVVVAEALPVSKSSAGWARKRAMDMAAERLIAAGHHDGVILTTDADSCVAPTWVSATMQAFANGADCVAGYIDAHPTEMMRLGAAFVGRGRLEDRYLRAIAEIYALCDPRPHDPWPNHRVSSGASLAVTLNAYLSIGGLPPRPVGEDVALTQALDRAGFKVRHAMDVCVSTSCRFDGRAKGGAADTMRHRHSVAEAPCDDDMEPALFVVRRALSKGHLRRLDDLGLLDDGYWAVRLGRPAWLAHAWPSRRDCAGFEDFWMRASETIPALRQRYVLRPSDLPRQIERATMCLRALRTAISIAASSDRAGRHHPPISREPVAA